MMGYAIDQPETDIFAVQINFFPAVIRTHAHDQFPLMAMSAVSISSVNTLSDSGIFKTRSAKASSACCRDPAFQLIRRT